MQILIPEKIWLKLNAGAQSAYPNEFIGLIMGEKTKNNDILITNMLIPPGVKVTSSWSSFNPWQIPPTVGEIGTFHSHPRGPAKPSRADSMTAAKEGGLQLIISYPFEKNNLRAYDNNSEELKIKFIKN